jgi:hypothetical protein
MLILSFNPIHGVSRPASRSGTWSTVSNPKAITTAIVTKEYILNPFPDRNAPDPIDNIMKKDMMPVIRGCKLPYGVGSAPLISIWK